ncbi:bifunctional coenzyme A synthase-like [Copidosoma floridanum]|uniref:bifunctional coenzyme A synthase-like n=1 Tax=Copidosoma floridanum TaxID=29053 RepID=UPI0006C970DB|nr:bifunctional coenzyme A synthase-like [Copidosoma floridanum]
MVNTGLLILTNPAKVAKLLPIIKKHVLKTLYIQYFPDKNILYSTSYSQLPFNKLNGPCYSHIVANIYASASSYSNCLDVRVLLLSLKNSSGSTIRTKRPVELVIFDETYNTNDVNTLMQDYLDNMSIDCEFLMLNQKNQELSCVKSSTNVQSSDGKVYKNVVLGGTFDRLHTGHKIFLSEAILRCSHELTVGVTDSNMIQRKILWELIEPCSKRIALLQDFAEDVDPSLKYYIVPITDIYGPTKDDPSFELIVVSEETKKGGDLINHRRTENNLRKLDIHVVKLAEDPDHNEHEEVKISSSNNRMRLLGTRLKQPNRTEKPIQPYIIGLTGGIASGKSSIADKLQKLGAGLINCDFIAHALYAPGMNCYHKIIDTFGNKYLNQDGQVNRNALGSLVFNDKSELEKLNKILWPAVLEEAKNQVNELNKKGFKVVVVEAAVLIQAGWQQVFHEIWTCIIPYDEAVKRLMNRNNLTKEEAEKRILVQPGNIEQVKNAHVVISTLWSYEVTQQQVERAWNEVIRDL